MSIAKTTIATCVLGTSLLLNAKDVSANITDFMQEEARENVNICRVIKDKNYVILHSSFTKNGVENVGFDVLLFDGGEIKKAWSNVSSKTPNNPSGRSQIDGETQIKDKEKTEANKEIVRNFIQEILLKHAGNMEDYIDQTTYIQHNSNIADGINGLLGALKYLGEHNIKLAFDKNVAVFGEGDFVLAVSEGEFGKMDANGNAQKVAYYDLFRLQNGKIVEHWDIIAPLKNQTSF